MVTDKVCLELEPPCLLNASNKCRNFDQLNAVERRLQGGYLLGQWGWRS